jgi:hypothetical protein
MVCHTTICFVYDFNFIFKLVLPAIRLLYENHPIICIGLHFYEFACPG